MKVGTDGVLLGSVAALYHSEKTLDIGTGCGLVALLMAQKSEAHITGIDIDPMAINTALHNRNINPWKNQLEFIHVGFQQFAQNTKDKFDLIVCNPPFYNNSLKSPDNKRNIARHTLSLKPAELLKGIKNLLNPSGIFLIITPFQQEKNWRTQAQAFGLCCIRRICIYPKPGKHPIRIILGFSLSAQKVEEYALTIETNVRNVYTRDYINLTGDYYLGF